MTRKIATCLIALLMLALGGPLSADQDDLCSRCGRPFTQGYRIDGKPFCFDHGRDALPHCANCGEVIQGNYTSMGTPMQAICSACTSHRVCFLCAGPADFGRGGVQLSDGRPLCARDREQAVFDPHVATSIFEQALRDTVSTFGTTLLLKTPVKEVKLVDVAGLVTASERQYPEALLLSGRLLGLTKLVWKTNPERSWLEPATIHLLNGVPAERMLAVCVHEYAHIWQAENHPRYSSTTPLMREGFAEWISYKVAEQQRPDGQAAREERPADDIYVQGLRKFRELEAQESIAGVLRYAVEQTDL